ncbi:MAG: universal stress protein [Phascolarctobacterium sp.]|nr:universal stress protein [Phascolarctobacterium sp.]
MFKKVLVPIDGSDHAWHALKKASELCKKLECELVVCTVLSVYQEISPGAPLVSALQMELREEQHKLEHKFDQAISLAKEKLADYPFPVEYVQAEGDAAEEILCLAKTKHCDGIIIGSRGLGTLKGFFLGSVSTTVAQEAEVPVLIVK